MDFCKLVAVLMCLLIGCHCQTTDINVPINQRCVPLDSCSGLPSGVYPTCTTCTKFVTCTNGIYRTFPCPPGQMFDPTSGMCSATATCNLAALVTANTPNPSPSVTHVDKPTTTTMSTTPSTTTSTTTMMTTTKAQKKVIVKNGRGFVKTITFLTGCVNNCYGQSNGYFPSCSGCNGVVVCMPYRRRIARCRHGYKWDDRNKCCQSTSSTCQEVITKTPRRYSFFSGYGWK